MTDKAEIQMRPTFRGIQALRGFAACLVVILHATHSWSQQVGNGNVPSMWANGATGVDIFFVISGFVMAVSTIGREHKTHPARSFLERRLIRVAPLYWILTAVALVKLEILKAHPEIANLEVHTATTLPYVLCSFLFIPYRSSVGSLHPLVSVGWTLSYEMFFYILFAIALALRVRVVLFLTPVMIALVTVGLFHSPGWPSIMVLTDPILLEFLAGVLLGHFMLKGFRIGPVPSVLMGAIGLGILLFVPGTADSGLRAVKWGIPALLVVTAVVMVEERWGEAWPRWTLILGDASYSLYLLHMLAQSIIVKIMSKSSLLAKGAFGRGDEVVVAVILLLGSVASSLLLYWWLERPMTNGLRRVWLHERKPQSQVA